MAAFSDIFEGIAVSVATVEVEADRLWRIEAFFQTEPDETALSLALALAAAAGGWPTPELRLRAEPLADWVQATYRRFPVPGGEVLHSWRSLAGSRAGCGHSAHHRGGGRLRLGRARLDLRLPPGAGSVGAAASPAAVIDLGCGSGILGIAAAKVWRVAVTGADNDPVAVRTAVENAWINGLRGRFRGRVSTGFGNPRLAGPYDLILANILANPLVRLARSMAPRLAPGGRAVLSGLLVKQERLVLQAYRAQGLALEGRIRRGEWVTLVVKEKRRQDDLPPPVSRREGRKVQTARLRFSLGVTRPPTMRR